MARPPISKETILYIYRLRGLGKTIDQILGDLEDTIARGTVAKYTKRFDNFSDYIKLQHRTVEWHQLHNYQLPSEATRFLMEMWFRIQESFFSTMVRLPPTGTQARWWWFVHSAAPEINNVIDIVVIAERFIIREMLHQMLGEPLVLEDLQSQLAYKPWLSAQRRASYLQAVEAQRIPPLSLDQVTQDAANVAGMADVDKGKAVLLSMISKGLLYLEAPELLFSQQLANLRKKNPEMAAFSLVVLPAEDATDSANLSLNLENGWTEDIEQEN